MQQPPHSDNTILNDCTILKRICSRYDLSPSPTVPISAGESFSFSVNPSGVAFGNQMLNTSSAQKSVTLTNTGSAPQPVFGRVNGPPGNWQDFTQTNDCPSKLAGGAKLHI